MKSFLFGVLLLLSSSVVYGRNPACDAVYFPSAGVDVGFTTNNQVGDAMYAGVVMGTRDNCGLLSGPFIDVSVGPYGYGTTYGLLGYSVLKLKVTDFRAAEFDDEKNPYKNSRAYTVGIHAWIVGFDVGQMVEDTDKGKRTVPTIGLNFGF